MSDATINDKSHFKISLPMAIQAITFVAAMVYGYSELSSRISFIEHEVNMNSNAIKDILELQDKPIPSDIRQDTRLDNIESAVSGNSDDLEYMKRKIYGGNK